MSFKCACADSWTVVCVGYQSEALGRRVMMGGPGTLINLPRETPAPYAALFSRANDGGKMAMRATVT